MTVGSPLITSWNERGIPWKFEAYPLVTARQKLITLAPAGQPGDAVRFPDTRWESEEGLMRYGGILSDSPVVGFRFKTGNMDFQQDIYALGLNAGGLTVPDGYLWNPVWAAPVIIPPYVNIPVAYAVLINQEWEWRKWMEIWLTNGDPAASHVAFAFYFIAYTTESKITLNISEALPLLNLRDIIQYINLFNGEIKKVKTNSIEAEFWEHNAVPFKQLMVNMGVKM